MAASTTTVAPMQEQKQQGAQGPARRMICRECGKPHFAQQGMASQINVCSLCIGQNHRDWVEPPKAAKSGWSGPKKK